MLQSADTGIKVHFSNPYWGWPKKTDPEPEDMLQITEIRVYE